MADEPEMTMIDARDSRRIAHQAGVLGVALEHALCDLIAVHGMEYLDRFLSHRLDKLSQTGFHFAAAGIPRADVEALGAQRFKETMDDGAEALREVIERVRRDPTSPMP